MELSSVPGNRKALLSNFSQPVGERQNVQITAYRRIVWVSLLTVNHMKYALDRVLLSRHTLVSDWLFGWLSFSSVGLLVALLW